MTEAVVAKCPCGKDAHPLYYGKCEDCYIGTPPQSRVPVYGKTGTMTDPSTRRKSARHKQEHSMRILSALLIVLLLASVSLAQVHSHRCPACGVVWTHSDSNQGFAAPHHCPACGAGPTWRRAAFPGIGFAPRYYQAAPVRRYVPRAYVVPRVYYVPRVYAPTYYVLPPVYSACPGGVCP